jgi:SAM-dependent methyltransferase
MNSRVQKGKKVSSSPASSPKLYGELASWWPLILPPDEYVHEAEYCRRVIVESCRQPPRTLLELGSGGGNVASHLKRHFNLTLVDRSPEMLGVSAALNPECEHIEGDMRNVRLNRKFNAVLIHDAIMYMTTETELAMAIRTAFEHCEPGGVAVFVPDCIRENFRSVTTHGGRDNCGRAARCLWWTWDADPTDTRYELVMAYVLRGADGTLQFKYDLHHFGFFARSTWLAILRNAGFQVKVITVKPNRKVFVGVKARS